MNAVPAAPRAGRALLGLAELGVAALVVVVVLLYTPRLADQVLGKTATVHILSGVVGLAWAVGRALEGTVRRSAGRLLLPFGLFLGIAAVASVASVNPGLAAERWLFWAQGAFLLLVAADLGRDRRRTLRLVTLLVGLSPVVAVIGLLQVAGMDPLGLPGAFGRMPLATLGNTNFVAHYLEIVLPLALALAAAVATGRLPRLYLLPSLASLSLAGLHLLLAGSRGGWLGVALAVVVMATAGGFQLRTWARRGLLAALVAALLSPVVGFVLRTLPAPGGGTAYDAVVDVAAASWDKMMTTFDPENFSRSMRLMIWRDTVRVIRAQPLLGVGPGQLGMALPAYRTTTGQRQWRALMAQRDNQPYHAHNEFLEVWAETGVGGLAALLWLLAAALWLGVTTARRADGVDRALVLGALGGITAAVVHAAFSFNLRDPVSGTHLWIVCGLLAGARARIDAGATGGQDVLASPSAAGGPWARLGVPVMALLLGSAGAWYGLCMLMGDHYYLRGREQLADGYGNRAILALRQAVDWRGDEFRYQHLLGQVALRMGRPGEAAQALGRSLELHPNNLGAIRLFAQAAADLKQDERAVAPLQRAVDIDPLTASNYILLADALRASGQPLAAAAVRRQAISLQGGVDQLVALALDHLAAGDAATARDVLEQAARTAPGNGLVAGQLGTVLLSLGEPVAAEAQLRRALELGDERAGWHGNLAQALVLQGRRAEALEQARAAAAAAPEESSWQQLVRRLEAEPAGSRRRWMDARGDR